MILVKNVKFLPSLFVFERGFNITLDDVLAGKKCCFTIVKKLSIFPKGKVTHDFSSKIKISFKFV